MGVQGCFGTHGSQPYDCQGCVVRASCRRYTQAAKHRHRRFKSSEQRKNEIQARLRLRHAVLQLLERSNSPRSTSEILATLPVPASYDTTKRALIDLHRGGYVSFQSQGAGRPTYWMPTQFVSRAA